MTVNASDITTYLAPIGKLKNCNAETKEELKQKTMIYNVYTISKTNVII